MSLEQTSKDIAIATKGSRNIKEEAGRGCTDHSQKRRIQMDCPMYPVRREEQRGSRVDKNEEKIQSYRRDG